MVGFMDMVLQGGEHNTINPSRREIDRGGVSELGAKLAFQLLGKDAEEKQTSVQGQDISKMYLCRGKPYLRVHKNSTSPIGECDTGVGEIM